MSIHLNMQNSEQHKSKEIAETLEIFSTEFINETSNADPMDLWGLWAGEEKIEELLEELD